MLVAWKYKPRNTFIQSLDPRARLIFMFSVILAITASQVWDIRVILPVAILVFALYFMARIPWKDVRRAWFFIAFLVVLIIGVNSLLTGRSGPSEVVNEHSPIIFQLPGFLSFIKITTVKAWYAMTQITRMLTMAALAIPIPYTIDPGVYGISFRQMGLPDKASFTMDLAFRFVPTLGRDFAVTVDAQRARGYELESLKGGLLDKLRRLAPLIIPVTMQSIVTGEEVIDAMDLRAFGVKPRTWLIHLQYHLRDYLYIGLGLLVLVGMAGFAITGHGRFWIPEWFLHLGH